MFIVDEFELVHDLRLHLGLLRSFVFNLCTGELGGPVLLVDTSAAAAAVVAGLLPDCPDLALLYVGADNLDVVESIIRNRLEQPAPPRLSDPILRRMGEALAEGVATWTVVDGGGVGAAAGRGRRPPAGHRGRGPGEAEGEGCPGRREGRRAGRAKASPATLHRAVARQAPQAQEDQAAARACTDHHGRTAPAATRTSRPLCPATGIHLCTTIIPSAAGRAAATAERRRTSAATAHTATGITEDRSIREESPQGRLRPRGRLAPRRHDRPAV